MKKSLVSLSFLLCLILQGGFFNFFAINGVTPNLILCLTFILVFSYDSTFIIGSALVTSFIMDICFQNYVGISSFALFIVILCIIKMKETINRDYKLGLIIISFVNSVIYIAVSSFFEFLVGYRYNLIYWIEIQGIFIVYNTVVMFVVYLIFSKKILKYREDRYLVCKK